MKRKIIPYNPKLKELARQLRNNSTLGEILLWKKLKGKQMMGYDFHRQKPLGEYIADFFCHELMLVIEIDGGSHRDEEVHLKDIRKETDFKKMGLSILRFTEKEVRANVDHVCFAVQGWIEENGFPEINK